MPPNHPGLNTQEAALLPVYFFAAISLCAIIHLFQLEVSSFAIIDAIQRDLANSGAVLRHGHPEDVIHIARAFLVEGNPGGTVVSDLRLCFFLPAGGNRTYFFSFPSESSVWCPLRS